MNQKRISRRSRFYLEVEGAKVVYIGGLKISSVRAVFRVKYLAAAVASRRPRLNSLPPYERTGGIDQGATIPRLSKGLIKGRTEVSRELTALVSACSSADGTP